MMTMKKWLCGTLAVILACLMAAAGIVLYVDPFFQYHGPIPGFPYKVDNQVNQNPGLAHHMEYDSVLLGSSMTASFDLRWFREKLHKNTIKLSYNGAYPKDEANILDQIYDAEKDTLKAVYMAVDETTFSADTETVKFPIPKYLYDKNPFNNIEYLLNKDVLLNYILKPLIDRSEATNWDTLYRAWWTDEYYTKANVLMYYTPGEERNEALAPDLFLDAARKNLEVNILPYVEAHPETEFVFFFPPYSILYWYDVVRAKELDALLNEVDLITETLLSYDNVRVFNFQAEEELICKLSNYADYTHYHGRVSEYIVDCFENGNLEVSREDPGAPTRKLRRLAESYDYEAIWEDWNSD